MSDYYDSSASEDEEESFNPWAVASTRQEAAVEIASRVADIERLYKETIALADAHSLNVQIDLQSEHNNGHNHGEYIRWNSSSQHC